jgi:type IV pilus assembly protein PilE
MLRRIHKGFTLIELMIVVVVIAVLSAIAVPSYKYYVLRGNRAASRTAIQNTAQQEERYFTQNNTYLAVPAGSTTTAGWINYVGGTYGSRTADLTVAVTAATTTLAASFTITATPVTGGSFSDTECGALTLTSAGVQGYTPASSSTPISQCWER